MTKGRSIRPRIARAVSLLFILISLVSWGCGGGSGSPGGPGGGGTIPTGGVTGRLMVVPGGTSVVFGTPPAGSIPIPNARVAVVGRASTTTAADGTFNLPAVPAGSQTLQVSPASGPALSVPLTVIPGAVITVGDPPTTRAAAVALVNARLAADGTLAGSGIWAAQQPLPAGVKVGSAIWADDAKGPSFTTTTSQWIVYVDPASGLRFGHDVTCYFVDALTGELSTLDSDSWPSLNGYAYYRPTRAGEAASPDLVKAPPTRAASVLGSASGHDVRGLLERIGRASTGKTYALLVRGTDTLNTKPDIEHVKGFFGSLPFPEAADVDVLETPTMPSGTDAVAEFITHFNGVAAKTKAGDTFVLYVSSHGARNRVYGSDGGVVGTEYFTILETEGRGPNGRFNPGTLDFSKVAACNIVVIADTCYSGHWISLLQPQLTGMTGKKVVILTASSADKPAGDADPHPLTVGGNTVTLQYGGLYTSSLHVALKNGFTDPDLYKDLAAANTTASLIAQASWDYLISIGDPTFSKYKGQFPQIWQRPLADGEGCFGETVIVRSKGLKQ